MKKCIIGLMLFLGIRSAYAQTEQGNTVLGFSGNLELQLAFPNRFEGNIAPQAGWFIRDNLALGPQIFFGWRTTRVQLGFTSMGVGVMMRYYLPSSNQETKWRFYGVAIPAFHFNQTKVFNPNNTAQFLKLSDNAIALSGGIGTNFFVSNQTALEAELRYQWSDSEVSREILQQGSRLFLNLGIVFFIGKK